MFIKWEHEGLTGPILEWWVKGEHHKRSNTKALQCRFLGHKLLEYRKSKDNKYEIDPNIAPIVVRIFDYYVNSLVMQEVADKLNSQRLKTMINWRFNANGLYGTLTNYKYTGIWRYGEIEIKDGMPAIISEETFDKAQKLLRKKKKTKNYERLETRHRYWLTGKLFCSHCESLRRPNAWHFLHEQNRQNWLIL